MLNIKDIALKHAREYLTFKLGGRKGLDVEEIVCDDEIYKEIVNELAQQFEAIIAELANGNEPVDHTPGEWFMCYSIDQMQAFYMSRLPAIREAAKEHGYAIGLHGSARRDFDLMAMPWRDGCSSRETLAHAVAQAACGIDLNGEYQWEKKPNGRWAVSMCICWTDHSEQFKGMLSVGHIDLSVMEPPTASKIEQETAEACAKVCEKTIAALGYKLPSEAIRSGAWKEFKK